MFELRDLSNADQNRAVLRSASELLDQHGSDIAAFDESLSLANADQHPPLLLEAARCARSRFELATALQGQPRLELSVVWAMYGETIRLGSTASGQDLLRHKIEQMRWLTDELDVSWHLVAVDDGCPESPSSAQVARDLLATQSLVDPDRNERVSVLELSDGLGPDREPGLSAAFRALGSTSESRKGGSIVFGLWKALQEFAPGDDDRHVLIYTDADLSANLAQAGLLVAPIVAGATAVTAGQRYGAPGAVLINGATATCEPVSTGTKPDKMIVLFRHFVRGQLFAQLRDVADTQAGFKAFSAELLRRVLPQVEAFDETFDVELLIRCGNLATASITFVEDFEQSNFQTEVGDGANSELAEPGQRHFDMITQLLGIHDRLPTSLAVAGTRDATGSELLRWLRGMNLERYKSTIKKLQSSDAARRERGETDPLFGVSWTLDELS